MAASRRGAPWAIAFASCLVGGSIFLAAPSGADTAALPPLMAPGPSPTPTPTPSPSPTPSPTQSPSPSPTVPAGCRGTAANDVLVGTGRRDTCRGLGGNDTIRTLAAKDFASGGPGNDTLQLGRGNDTARGGPGGDTINCGPGEDRVLDAVPKEDTLRACDMG